MQPTQSTTFSLHGRAAVVTGGARNIGRVLVETFARSGAHVLCCDVLDEEGEAVAQRLRAEGHHVLYQHADMRVPAEIEAVAEQAAAQFGRLNLWVHNAMVDRRNPVTELSVEDWDAVHDVCLRAAFLGAKYAIPHLIRAGGGSIINIGSVHALVTYAYTAAYDSAKAGLVALTRQIAGEYGRHNIRANVVLPGLIHEVDGENASENDPNANAAYDQSRPFYPMNRIGKASDVAQAVLYLASDAAGWVTGISLVVDGGMTTRSPEWLLHAGLPDQPDPYIARQDARQDAQEQS